jgi:hypothetical protein
MVLRKKGTGRRIKVGQLRAAGAQFAAARSGKIDVEQEVWRRIAAEPAFEVVLKRDSTLEERVRKVIRLIIEEEKLEQTAPEAETPAQDDLKSIVFYQVPRPITDEILDLSESMNDAYLEKEAERVFEKESGLQEVEVIEDDSSDSWPSRLIEGLSKALFHSSEEEPPMPDEEFRAVFQKEVAERIYDHLAMLTRAGYEEGDEPFSIMEEFTQMMVWKLGLGLSRDEDIGEEMKHRVELVLHRLAWDFQSWLILEHHGKFPAVFGEIYTSVPEKIPANGKLLVLAADVAPPLEALMEPVVDREPQFVSIDELSAGGVEIPDMEPVYMTEYDLREPPPSIGEIMAGGEELPRKGYVYIVGPVSHGGIFTGTGARGRGPFEYNDLHILRSAVRQVRHGNAFLDLKTRT